MFEQLLLRDVPRTRDPFVASVRFRLDSVASPASFEQLVSAAADLYSYADLFEQLMTKLTDC